MGEVAARLRDTALAMPGAWEDSPWGGDTVAKVGDKIFAFLGSGRARSRGKADGGRGGRGAAAADVALGARRTESVPASELANLIQELTTQMHQAAGELHFELAARLRDEIGDLKKELRQMSEATR